MADDQQQPAEPGIFGPLQAQWEVIGQFRAVFEASRDPKLDFVQDKVARCLERIAAFEPSVTVIGQVKAGKSTLLNALIGTPDFLPVDVNPWTSVITALHFNAADRPVGTRALFRFFDQHEWDRLVETGGRLGEMAQRAGFEAEAEDLREQVRDMRAATEARLGAEFNRLLGQSHAYADFDQDVIDRYICYGDPQELAEGAREGFYADVTKSADLYIEAEGFPPNLCFRDTPGVNDTFMIREQITLNAIGESRACIVVLSAHQALSMMDMALLRIICAIDAREVVIFVNRMDELADPVAAEAQLRASITRTLDRFGLAEGIDIFFGSGYWAQMAQAPDPRDMAPSSLAALEVWARARQGGSGLDPAQLRETAFAASGLGALIGTVAQRIAEGPCAAMIEDLKAAARNIASTIEMVRDRAQGALEGIDGAAIRARLALISDSARDAHAAHVAMTRTELEERLHRAQDAFVDSALDALAAHVAAQGEAQTWTHDPMSLRMALRSAYLAVGRKLDRLTLDLLDEKHEAIATVLAEDLPGLDPGPPDAGAALPDLQAPAGIAMTLSLDLNRSWWRRFWSFGAPDQRLRRRYASLIRAETAPMIEGILQDSFGARARLLGDLVQDRLADRISPLEVILAPARGAAANDAKDVA